MKKKWFASDMAFKIYSLLIAIFLWVFVIYDQNPDSTKLIRNIPITYSNLDSLERSGYTVLEEDLYVDFRVKGKRVSLGNLSKENIRASVTFSDFREGEYNLSIDAKLPQNDMSVSARNPEKVSVKVEKLVTKELPIGIIYTGTNAQGKLASANLKTPTLTAMGPESVMNRVKNVRVILDYAAVATAETGTTDIHIFDSEGNDMTYDRNLRLSTNRIIWEQKLYNVKDAEVEVTFESDDTYVAEGIEISEKSIKLSSDKPENLNFEKVSTLPLTEQDIEKLKNGEAVDVLLNLPENVELLKQDENGLWTVDEAASIKISAKVMDAKKIMLTPGENIEITNQNTGKSYLLSELPEYILLKYTSESPEKLEDIKFKVNAENLSAGEHTVEITAVLPETVAMAEKYTAKLLIQNH